MKKETKKKDSDSKIKAEMSFGEAIHLKPFVARILAEEGMFCGGCPMAMMETIEQGAEVHGVDLDKLLKKLNK